MALFYSARLGLHEAGPPTRNTHLHLREILGISVVQSRVEILKKTTVVVLAHFGNLGRKKHTEPMLLGKLLVASHDFFGDSG